MQTMKCNQQGLEPFPIRTGEKPVKAQSREHFAGGPLMKSLNTGLCTKMYSAVHNYSSLSGRVGFPKAVVETSTTAEKGCWEGPLMGKAGQKPRL